MVEGGNVNKQLLQRPLHCACCLEAATLRGRFGKTSRKDTHQEDHILIMKGSNCINYGEPF